MSRSQATSAKMQREIRKAEAVAHETNLKRLRAQEITGPVQDSGTGQTILRLKRHQPPLATLVEGKKIGALELQAANEIELAAFSVHLGGRLAAVDIQRVDHGRQGDNPWPMEVAIAIRNYQKWQNHWSREHKLTGNPMLEVIWCAVIDERPISVISQEIGYGRHLTAKAIICGLRHYAAHAGMTTGAQARIWLGNAQHVFDRRPTNTIS